MSHPKLALTATLLTLLAAGCGKSSDTGTGKTSTSTAGTSTKAASTPSASSGGPCTPAKATNKGPQHIAKPTALLPANKPATLVLTTNCGEIDIALDVKRARRTASSVAYLVRKGFYDGLPFHRIAKLPTGGDFVIQGGDPTGTGNGGPGYSVRQKAPPNQQYTRGVVAMAKTEIEPSGTSGSQFFIVTAEDAGLPPDYALLGKVTKGDDVVSKIAAVPTDSTEHPTTPVVITSAKIR
jgi:peptidyl-prolyl cis-trans isomerase B (cyclophilin B)